VRKRDPELIGGFSVLRTTDENHKRKDRKQKIIAAQQTGGTYLQKTPKGTGSNFSSFGNEVSPTRDGGKGREVENMVRGDVLGGKKKGAQEREALEIKAAVSSSETFNAG